MLDKVEILSLDYAFRGTPFVRWISADIDTKTLDYSYRGEPYNAALEEYTIYLELAGTITATSDIQNARLSFALSLAGDISGETEVSSADLALWLIPTSVYGAGASILFDAEFLLVDRPNIPHPAVWDDIFGGKKIPWGRRDGTEAAWYRKDAPSHMGWNVRSGSIGMWRTILTSKDKTWEKKRDAKSLSHTQD